MQGETRRDWWSELDEKTRGGRQQGSWLRNERGEMKEKGERYKKEER